MKRLSITLVTILAFNMSSIVWACPDFGIDIKGDGVGSTNEYFEGLENINVTHADVEFSVGKEADKISYRIYPKYKDATNFPVNDSLGNKYNSVSQNSQTCIEISGKICPTQKTDKINYCFGPYANANSANGLKDEKVIAADKKERKRVAAESGCMQTANIINIDGAANGKAGVELLAADAKGKIKSRVLISPINYGPMFSDWALKEAKGEKATELKEGQKDVENGLVGAKVSFAPIEKKSLKRLVLTRRDYFYNSGKPTPPFDYDKTEKGVVENLWDVQFSSKGFEDGVNREPKDGHAVLLTEQTHDVMRSADAPQKVDLSEGFWKGVGGCGGKLQRVDSKSGKAGTKTDGLPN
jgi:hypothetical protein